MTTTTVVNAAAIAAGAGGISVPVKLALQATTVRLAVELLVLTTPAASNELVAERKHFTAFFCTTSQDFAASLATVPTKMSGCIHEVQMPKIHGATHETKQSCHVEVKGENVYVWYSYPRSLDAYTLTIRVTEIPA